MADSANKFRQKCTQQFRITHFQNQVCYTLVFARSQANDIHHLTARGCAFVNCFVSMYVYFVDVVFSFLERILVLFGHCLICVDTKKTVFWMLCGKSHLIDFTIKNSISS